MERTTDESPRVIQGRYRVERRLGRGTSGIVYACVDTKLGSSRVALKIFPSHAVADRTTSARIQRELLSAFRVNHDNVVRFYEPVSDGDLLGYSMEFVEGAPLEELVQKRQPLDPIEAVEILQQICAGLDAIHAVGIIHRDVKPANVMMTADGIVKVTDLGLAKGERLEADQKNRKAEFSRPSRVTQDGETPGTPDYISPEYIEHGTCDWRSDLYAVGVIGYELITGRTPFADCELYNLMRKKVEEDPTPAHMLNGECPREVSDWLLKALSRDPDGRFQSAREMREALLAIRAKLFLTQSSTRARGEEWQKEVKELRSNLRRRERTLLVLSWGIGAIAVLSAVLVSARYGGEIRAWLDTQFQVDTWMGRLWLSIRQAFFKE